MSFASLIRMASLPAPSDHALVQLARSCAILVTGYQVLGCLQAMICHGRLNFSPYWHAGSGQAIQQATQ